MGLKNIDKKFTITTALLAMLLVTTGIGAYETTQVRTLLSNGATPDSSAPAAQAPAAPSADEPTKKPSEYKFGIPYEKAVKAKKPMIVLFYADWCHFCVGFMPIYEQLYKNHKRQFNFVKVNVENAKYADAVKKYEISAFPTVFMVNPRKDTHEQLKNENFGDMNKLDELMNTFYENNK
ncbi:MAG: protein disulfide isomerase family protein [Cyanobacteriota bacterium]|nr:protein disulfide isomerase family protein [Cyanobacteriota bacterium]MDY6358584.1 protein disulfide isomerase family protein [Cyanobacteriota bacterium]MDY6364613.1 protein disulfide isomerase family protein [Cyanobacteriota bacterium]MDY6383053.1 protein disulfide isomerase family protein [Cyanobacteriota bacterium]